jgi:tetratricopeptide (TPR) repeat protein
MSRRLGLIEYGMAAARSLARQGRRTDALAQAKRLLARPDLTTVAAADTHRVAAELLMDAERYVAARRHLRAALALESEHARTNYLMGLAFENDPHGDDERAARRFGRASRLVPSNAQYRAAYGRAAVRSGRTRSGVRELLAAAESALRDSTVLEVVIEGLIEAGQVRTAERIIVKARFLCPGSGEVRRLGERVRFEAARRGQKRGSSTQDAGRIMDGAAQLLPFVRVVRSSPGGTMPLANVRRDLLSRPRPHLTAVVDRN